MKNAARPAGTLQVAWRAFTLLEVEVHLFLTFQNT